MATQYPGTLDSFATSAGTSLLTSPDHSDRHNTEGSAIIAVETLLGTASGSNYLGTVKAVSTQLGTYVVNATPTANNIPVLDANALLPSSLLLKSKVKLSTYNLATASGDVAYTGIGFTPTSMICFANVDGSAGGFSIGVVDSAKLNNQILRNNNTLFYINGGGVAFIGIDPGTGNTSFAIVKSYDADGFTLTWTRGGTNTGTANLIFLCFR
jgi:hypothetical protein